jgi:hypothetical protein
MKTFKNVALVLVAFSFVGCSIQKRIGKEIGCDEKDVKLIRTIPVPAYTKYTAECQGKLYDCHQSPVSFNCKEAADVGTKVEEPAKKKKK